MHEIVFESTIYFIQKIRNLPSGLICDLCCCFVVLTLLYLVHFLQLLTYCYGKTRRPLL
uniref:Uncharacterized protein n=1 Tax=Arundo donax TaxID=35708 RepID=A0A0A9FED0_ARUDO